MPPKQSGFQASTKLRAGVVVDRAVCQADYTQMCLDQKGADGKVSIFDKFACRFQAPLACAPMSGDKNEVVPTPHFMINNTTVT